MLPPMRLTLTGCPKLHRAIAYALRLITLLWFREDINKVAQISSFVYIQRILCDKLFSVSPYPSHWRRVTTLPEIIH